MSKTTSRTVISVIGKSNLKGKHPNGRRYIDYQNSLEVSRLEYNQLGNLSPNFIFNYCNEVNADIKTNNIWLLPKSESCRRILCRKIDDIRLSREFGKM